MIDSFPHLGLLRSVISPQTYGMDSAYVSCATHNVPRFSFHSTPTSMLLAKGAVIVQDMFLEERWRRIENSEIIKGPGSAERGLRCLVTEKGHSTMRHLNVHSPVRILIFFSTFLSHSIPLAGRTPDASVRGNYNNPLETRCMARGFFCRVMRFDAIYCKV